MELLNLLIALVAFLRFIYLFVCFEGSGDD